MAKRKTQKIKNLKPESISNEQLEKLQRIINFINRSQLEIGSIETKKHDLLHGIAVNRDELTVMQTEFEKEYGTYDINIQTGFINYPENGEADKKD